jgi:Tfp pilus assembly PilM family ATPase
LEIVTSSNVYSKVDNKEIVNPVSSSGSVLECAVFNAFTPSYHVKAVQKVADKADVHIITLGSVSYAITQALKAVPQEPSDFVILNVGVDFTEAAVVFGGGVVATKTLNLGYQHFIEGINNKMGLTSRESNKVMESYCSGQLSESESVVVQKCIQDTLEIWTTGINLLFDEFIDVKTFAPQIYLTGKSAGIPDLITLLREKPWYKSIPFKALPQVKKLNLADLARITDATGKITAASWVPVVALGNIYLELYGNA